MPTIHEYVISKTHSKYYNYILFQLRITYNGYCVLFEMHRKRYFFDQLITHHIVIFPCVLVICPLWLHKWHILFGLGCFQILQKKQHKYDFTGISITFLSLINDNLLGNAQCIAYHNLQYILVITYYSSIINDISQPHWNTTDIKNRWSKAAGCYFTKHN